MGLIATLILVGIASATPGEARGQFDLVCAGQEEILSYTEHQVRAYEVRYRVDLDAGRWCADDCKSVLDVAKVLDDKIVLRDLDKTDIAGHFRSSNVVDRVTGAHSLLMQTDMPGRRLFGSTRTQKGQCVRAEFTGFPQVAKLF